MTTHEMTHGAPTPETWRAQVEANNDSAAMDPVSWVETLSPHYEPRGARRWLWHYAIPIGEMSPGVQAIVARSGTAFSRAAAERKIERMVGRHFAEDAGREPHAALFEQIRRTALLVFLIAVVALLVDSLGCSPAALVVVALAAGAVGTAANVVRHRRAARRPDPIVRTA